MVSPPIDRPIENKLLLIHLVDAITNKKDPIARAITLAPINKMYESIVYCIAIAVK